MNPFGYTAAPLSVHIYVRIVSIDCRTMVCKTVQKKSS